MNRFTAAIVLVFIFSSCADNSKNDLRVLRSAEQGMVTSNQTIAKNCGDLYRALEDRLTDHRMAQYAKEWQPKAMAVRQLSDDVYIYIENLKSDLKGEAGLHKEDYKEVFREDDMGPVERLFGEKGIGKDLYNKLENYEQRILAIDSIMTEKFKFDFISATRDFDDSKNKKKEFTDTYFSKLSVMAALVVLTKFENNVKVMEYEFVSYCFAKASPVIYNDDFNMRLAPLVSQSSRNLLPGEELEITAGIGTFSTAMKPVISINGIQIEPGKDGVVKYSFIPPPKPGNYSANVSIQYTKPDGTSGAFLRTLEYSVGLPK